MITWYGDKYRDKIIVGSFLRFPPLLRTPWLLFRAEENKNISHNSGPSSPAIYTNTPPHTITRTNVLEMTERRLGERLSASNPPSTPPPRLLLSLHLPWTCPWLQHKWSALIPFTAARLHTSEKGEAPGRPRFVRISFFCGGCLWCYRCTEETAYKPWRWGDRWVVPLPALADPGWHLSWRGGGKKKSLWVNVIMSSVTPRWSPRRKRQLDTEVWTLFISCFSEVSTGI